MFKKFVEDTLDMDPNERNYAIHARKGQFQISQRRLMGAIDTEVCRLYRKREEVQGEIEMVDGQIRALFQRGQKQRNEVKRLEKLDTDRNSLERLVDANKKLISILQKMKDDLYKEPEKVKRANAEQIQARRAITAAYKKMKKFPTKEELAEIAARRQECHLKRHFDC